MISIAIYHYTTRYQEKFGWIECWNFNFQMGSNAVFLFFLISGFLSIYTMKKRSIKVSAFNKICRLFPAYWISMIVTAIVVNIFEPSLWVGMKTFIIDLTMLQGAVGVGSVDGAYWTLFYDIVFYVVIAFIERDDNCRNKARFTFTSWLILTYLMMFIKQLDGIFVIYIVRKIITKFLILDRAYIFIAGASIAEILYSIPAQNDCFVYINLILCLCYPLVCGDISSFLVLSAMLLIMLAALLITHVHLPSEAKRTISHLSSISYEFYLLHQNIGYCILLILFRKEYTSELTIIIPFLIVICLAEIVHYASCILKVKLSHMLICFGVIK